MQKSQHLRIEALPPPTPGTAGTAERPRNATNARETKEKPFHPPHHPDVPTPARQPPTSPTKPEKRTAIPSIHLSQRPRRGGGCLECAKRLTPDPRFAFRNKFRFPVWVTPPNSNSSVIFWINRLLVSLRCLERWKKVFDMLHRSAVHHASRSGLATFTVRGAYSTRRVFSSRSSWSPSSRMQMSHGTGGHVELNYKTSHYITPHR